MERQSTDSIPLRLLIVDDEKAVRSPMDRYFRHLGWNVTLAAEEEEAAALLELRPFDALVTDLGLTPLRRSEGLDVLSHGRYHQPGLRIVVLTGQPSPELEEACLRQGADVFLAKPQPLPALASAVLGGTGAAS